MRNILPQIALLIVCSLPAFAQKVNDPQCSNINAIIAQLRGWRKKITVIRFPLSSKRQNPVIGNDLLEGGGLFRGSGEYFSSSAFLSGEYASEFGIDDQGKCFYTAYMGPYSKERIDIEGQRLKNAFLSCINRIDWQISNIENCYLFLSYKPVDITVTLIKIPIKDSNKFKLEVAMFRFTPLY